MSIIAFYFSVLSLLAPLVTLVGIGMFFGKTRNSEFPAHFISVLATSVSTPALVFHTLVTTRIANSVMAQVALGTLLALALAAGTCALLLRLARQPVRKMLQTATFPNAGNMGLPIAHMAFGDAGLTTAVAFFAICSFVQHTAGVRMLPNANMAKPWRSPILIAATLGALFRGIDFMPPAWVLESAALVGTLTVPLMLLSLGHALAVIPAAGLRVGSIVGSMRIAVGLGAGYLAGRLVGMPEDIADILAMQMGMPCAAVSYLYARRYTDMGDAAAGAVLVSTLAFLALAPLTMWLLGAPAAT